MKLFVRRFGQGIPVIILHGLLGVSDNWVTFVRKLGEHYEVFIPDMRNHGQSPHHSVFDFPSLVGDLMELLEEHDLGEIILIGHSLGGKVAMLFALQYPDRVTKLVIVDISLRKHEANREHQQLINAMLAVDFSLCNVRSDVEKQLIHDIRSARLRRFLLKNVYWRDKRSLDWRINLPVINANLPAISEGIDPGNEFKKPVLFVRGGLSDYILDDDIIKIHSTFPSAIIRTLENAGHWVHADEPLEFFEMVNDFLSRR